MGTPTTIWWHPTLHPNRSGNEQSARWTMQTTWIVLFPRGFPSRLPNDLGHHNHPMQQSQTKLVFVIHSVAGFNRPVQIQLTFSDKNRPFERMGTKPYARKFGGDRMRCVPPASTVWSQHPRNSRVLGTVEKDLSFIWFLGPVCTRGSENKCISYLQGFVFRSRLEERIGAQFVPHWISSPASRSTIRTGLHFTVRTGANPINQTNLALLARKFRSSPGGKMNTKNKDAPLPNLCVKSGMKFDTVKAALTLKPKQSIEIYRWS